MPHDFITLSKNAKDVADQRFGRLVALGPTGKNKRSHITWLCQCDCGNTTIVISAGLNNGTTRSCGCLKNELSSIRLKNQSFSTIHGMSRTPLYNTLKQMIQRCSNPKNGGYANYGGRGITVYDEWLQSFESFHDYVSRLPHCGEEGYSLDRIDNDRNYEPSNVRWSTSRKQLRNTRVNILLTHNGKTQCAKAWAEELGINYNTLWDRLYRGWSIDRALSTPVRTINKTSNRG